MLAIFDTQVLSIFRRQKEIGTYVALGMTRKQVVALFTVEGAMHSVLGRLGRSVLWHSAPDVQAIHGLPFPGAARIMAFQWLIHLPAYTE